MGKKKSVNRDEDVLQYQMMVSSQNMPYDEDQVTATSGALTSRCLATVVDLHRRAGIVRVDDQPDVECFEASRAAPPVDRASTIPAIPRSDPRRLVAVHLTQDELVAR